MQRELRSLTIASYNNESRGTHRESTSKIETRGSVRTPSKKKPTVVNEPPDEKKGKHVIDSPSRRKSPSRKVAARSPIHAKTADEKEIKTRRSPARRSPSRRSPARKSPSRIPHKADVKQSKESAVKRVIAIEADTDSDSQMDENVSLRSLRSRRRTSEFESSKMSRIEDFIRNSVARSSRTPSLIKDVDHQHAVHLKHTEPTRGSLTEYSDEELVVPTLPAFPTARPKEFGGTFGVLLLAIVTPILIIGVNFISEDKRAACTWSNLSFVVPRRVHDYLDAMTLLGHVAFVVALVLLNAIPFGGRKVAGPLNKYGKFVYRKNGLAIVAVTLAITYGLERYGVGFYVYVYENQLKLAVSTVVIAVVMSLYIYARSFYVPISALNPRLNDGDNGLYNYFMGREVQPRLFGVIDWKLFTLRYLHVGVIVYNLSCLYVHVGSNYTDLDFWKNANATLVTCCLMQIVWSVEDLAFEDVFLTSYEIQTEGYGYMMLIGYYGYPILFASISKHVLQHELHLNPAILFGQWFALIIGLTLKRLADMQKHSFRMNPYSKAVSHLKTIPTSSGQKLIVSGYWGMARHFNYLCQIIVLLVFVPFVWNTPHAVLILSNIWLLINRLYRDDRKCREKYGVSWDKYCEQVRYLLIPKIF